MTNPSTISMPHHHHAAPTHYEPMSLNRLAFSATIHCFTGCVIGEVLGLIVATAFGWSNAASIVTAVVLAFIFGYAFTLLRLVRSGMALVASLSLAFAADTVSISVMEVIDNGVMLMIPGAMEAGLTDGLFWGSLALSLAAAFVVALPVNRWLIAKGRGHAVVHAHHH